VTVASLHVRKGHDVLVGALGKVCVPAGRRLVWIFAGEGPERATLRQAVEGLGDAVSVRLPGQMKDVEMLLSAADLFCLPSRYEGLGVALLEAMAAGVPCVASRVGGMAESVIDGETGLHVPVGDEAALARAIESLIDDPQLARRLADGGRQRTAEQFDVRIMGESTLRLYRQLAGVQP
jgi:glycosyltransferase involved in cell wall biosynthesis